MDDETSSSGWKFIVMALGTLAIFCFLLWSMFADSRTATCVTKGRVRGNDMVQIHDVRWTANRGCEYLGSVNKGSKSWMPESKVLRSNSGR
jgi:hypothetical protein